MSPLRSALPLSPATRQAIGRVSLTLGLAVRDARTRRGWTMSELGRRAGISASTVHHVEAGRPASIETYARLAAAEGMRLEATIVDARHAVDHRRRDADPVHAAMGELEARVMRARGFPVSIDEPYQHFQFAGRADLVAWSAADRALLHVENRTRFPNLQEAAGAFNAKRAYLGRVVAERTGVRAWRSETHVIVVAWTGEATRDLRRYGSSIRSICPDEPHGFAGWWEGTPPTAGRRAELVVLDPGPLHGRQRRWDTFDRAITGRARHHGYAALARLLETAAGQAGIGDSSSDR